VIQYPDERQGTDPERDDERLKQQLGQLMSQPLDRSVPLWMVYDIRGFADGSSVLFIKIHVRATLSALTLVFA
jgi:hypothetical protein